MTKVIIIILLCIPGIACTAEPGTADGKNGKLSGMTDEALEGPFSSTKTLVSQANTHIQNQQYQQALLDMEKVISLAPDNSEYRFLYCLLQERTGERLAVAKRCYTEVVEQLSQKKPYGCEADLNCVVADLMAEGNQSQERKERFLALPTTEAESEVRHFLLERFDRQTYLKTILP